MLFSASILQFRVCDPFPSQLISQTLTVRSSLQLTKPVPSGENAMQATQSRCPMNFATSWPVCTLHINTSFIPAAMCFPSGQKRMQMCSGSFFQRFREPSRQFQISKAQVKVPEAMRRSSGEKSRQRVAPSSLGVRTLRRRPLDISQI